MRLQISCTPIILLPTLRGPTLSTLSPMTSCCITHLATQSSPTAHTHLIPTTGVQPAHVNRQYWLFCGNEASVISIIWVGKGIHHDLDYGVEAREHARGARYRGSGRRRPGVYRVRYDKDKPSLLIPDAVTYAKTVIRSIGCGYSRVASYLPHALFFWPLDVLPSWLREQVLVNMVKTMRKEALEKLKASTLDGAGRKRCKVAGLYVVFLASWNSRVSYLS